MSAGSERLFSLNFSIFALVKSLIWGLSFKDLVLKSIKVTFGRWSDRSVMRLPDEHLFWINFFGLLIKI